MDARSVVYYGEKEIMSTQLVVCQRCLGRPKTGDDNLDYRGLTCWCMDSQFTPLTLEILWESVLSLLNGKQDVSEDYTNLDLIE